MRRICLLTMLLSIFIGARSQAQTWKVFADSAKMFQDQRDNNRAIDYYVKAINELKRDSLGTASYTSCCHRLAILYFGAGKHDKAGPLLEEVRELRIKLVGREHIDFARSSGNLGLYYVVTGKYDKAEPLLIDARKLTEKIFGKEHAEYANLSNNIGMLYKDWGKHEKAEPYYIEAIAAREKIFGKEHVEYANSCNNLGVLYAAMGLFEKAEPLYVEATAIRKKVMGSEHPLYAASLNNLAILRRTMGKYAEAEKLYIEAMDIRKKALGNDHPDYAASLNNLAILYWASGDFEKVEPLHLEAIRIREKVFGKSSPDYTNSANNLATFYKDMGQFDKAEQLYVETNQIREAMLGTNHPEYAISLNNLAILYMLKGEYEKAEPLYKAAKMAREKSLGKAHPDYANSCNNLGILYSKMGKSGEAKTLFDEAKQAYEQLFGRAHPEYAVSCDNLAGFYSDQGQFETAEPLYLESRKIWMNTLGKSSSSYITNTNNLATIYWGMNNPEKAHAYFTEAMTAQRDNLERIFLFTTAREQLAYMKNASSHEEKALSFCMSGYPLSKQGMAYDMILSRRNLVLSSSRQLRQYISESPDTILALKYQEWTKSKEQLAFWMTKPVDERKGRDTMFEAKANTLEQELARLSTRFRNQQRLIHWTDIQKSLKQGEAAIEFSSFQYSNPKGWEDSVFYVAIIMTADDPEPKLVPLFEERVLDAIRKEKGTGSGIHAVNLLYKNGALPGSPAKPGLYDIIWKPLEREMKGIETVYFAPAGSLYKIAFAALPVNNKQTLSDKYRLVQLTSTSGITDREEETLAGTDRILLYGGIRYDADSAAMTDMAIRSGAGYDRSRTVSSELLRSSNRGFEYLSGSENEVLDISTMSKQKKYRVDVLNNMMGNEESFKSLFGSKSPELLHIATHGFFFPDPDNSRRDDRTAGMTVFRQSDNPLIRSGLVLAGANNAWKGKPIGGVEDGILTAFEVSNMYLPNTKLAVLSACETGLGDVQGSEGVYGLQRAFKMAGVENLVMSLWKVPDAETSEFMQQFYKNLFAKQTIQDAFYNAQKIMRNKYRNDPYKWAAWVLIR